MGSLRISTLLKGNAVANYSMLKEIERFREFMPQIRKIKVLWRLPPNRQISEWEVEVEGITIHWKQEDTFDDEHRTFTFRIIEGDYRAEGSWKIDEVTTSRSKISIKARFDWGIPILGQQVGQALERKAKRNFMRMVAAFRKAQRDGVSISG